MRWWDFVFYMLFGLVVTSFVHIGGVLLVFSYLVVPAVCATYLVNSIPARFAVGWGIATLASVVSLFVTATRGPAHRRRHRLRAGRSPGAGGPGDQPGPAPR